ncbi:hypothetical protein AAVH_19411 [Aphelenchoides avenae]|nr:hypothetical protein AAVH_19411 [Aphelenchus avenae]
MSSSAASTPTDGPTTSVASSTPAPCDCVNIIDNVCQAADINEECIIACQGVGLGAGVCVGLPIGIEGLDAAVCVCIGPFNSGSGGNGCGAGTTSALPTTTQSAATTASESVTSTSAHTTSVAQSSTPAPCDCVNVIRGVCQTVDDTQQCAAACQGQGLGGGFCVGVHGVNAEVALCVCIGPFLPGSGGSNGCVADTTPALPATTPSAASTASESSSSSSVLTTSVASSSPAPCDCVNVIRGVCRAIVDTENCITACHGLGLGAGVCVDLFGVGVEAALCVCTGPFGPGSAGGNGCEAGTTLSLPSTTPTIASSSEPTTASVSPSTSAVSTTAPGQCIRSIEDICKDPLSIVDKAICEQQCKLPPYNLRAGICVSLPPNLGVALCICL